jgi:tetratricopeptide (TPR) repeat protein
MAKRKSSSVSKVKDQETFAVALEAYETAIQPFHQRDWDVASGLLEAFVAEYTGKPDVSEMVDRARTHILACRRKSSEAPAEPSSPEEWLYEGVSLANKGHTDEALESLNRAVEGDLPAGRVDYVRAAALAIAERHDEALRYLARAIEAEPDNRAFSLSDPDFERLRETAGYVALVEPPHNPADRSGEVSGYEQGTTARGGGIGFDVE